MSVNRYLVPVLTVVLLLGTVGVAQLTGDWIVSGKEMINVEQMTSSADIRGWMTLEQVATGLHMELSVLYELAGIPADVPPDTALKDLEGILPDFETSAVRDAVALYLGEVERAAVEPVTPAPTVSAATPEPTAATPLPPATHAPQGDGTGTGEGTGPTPLPPGTQLAASEIKGRHTLQEIVDQAEVPLDALLAELGLPPETDPGQSVRELVEAGLVDEVETIRSAVTALQAAGQ